MSRSQTSKSQLEYTYTGADEYQPPKDGAQDSVGRVYYPYLPSSDLVEAVKLAIALQRPLLLEGEPGCGKTRLAGAIAYELTQRHLAKQPIQTQQGDRSAFWSFYTWTIKSTTRARDGLYTYDAVARLRDAQLMGSNPDQLKEYLGEEESQRLKVRLQDKKNYREFGPLGKALRPEYVPLWLEADQDTENKLADESEQIREYRPIVLIDEIDKADSDFPNDLLLELEELRFEVPETDEKIPPPVHKPIILITSNREKPLPEPFLRRCIYFFVEFPDEVQLREIIKRRFGEQVESKAKVVAAAIARFYEIRELLDDRPGSRAPGTSEFLEFLAALLRKKTVNSALADLKKLPELRSLLGTLIKTRADQELYRSAFSQGKSS